MAVSANLFVTDSLVGSTQVKNAFANINVGTRPLAFIGDQSFVVKLRRNSAEGDVIATTPQITIRDNAALVSFVANTNTVAEGDLVEFTLTTTGAANNAVLYYSTLAVTSNVDARDFVGSNTGSFLLVDNVGKIVLQANADGSLADETGETFKLQVRTGSVTGNVVLVSDNVSILDISNVSSYFISQTSTSVVEGSNVTFTINSVNVPDGTEVFYTTAGNVRSYNFTTGNTGSRIIVNGSNTINLVTAAIPNNETRQFTLQLREGSTSGQIKTSSQNVTILDSALNNINATGGTIVDSAGFRTHIFTSTSNLNIISTTASPITADLLIIGGGGGGGKDNNYTSPGGGAGGLREISYVLTSGSVGVYTMTVGAGGAAATKNGPGGNPSSAFNYVSSGGGRGTRNDGGPPYQAGGPGGSGGGGSGYPGNHGGGTGNTPPVSPPQGNPGGNGHPSNGGGGGGGAGGAGGNAPGNPNGVGGIGKSISWIPASYGTSGPTPGRWFSGGGGVGGTGSRPATPGGSGGGGPGGTGPGTATTGTVNTGGGGGGEVVGGGAAGGSGGSGIIAVRYPFTPSPTFALIESSTSITDSSNITFSVITTNVANNYVLYYRTSGNVISTDFVQGNTGLFAVVNNAANITLTANGALAQGEERIFTFQILEGAVDGDVILVSNTITVTPSPEYLEATGGTIIDEAGYRLHVFTTSADFTVNSLTGDAEKDTVNYLVVAGGGGSGALHNGNSPIQPGFDFRRGSGGGGAGGLLTGNILLSSSQPYSVIIGGGGAGGVRYQNNTPPAPPNTAGNFIGSPGSPGANSSIFGLVSFGGGGGACHKPSIFLSPFINQALATIGEPGGSGGGAGAVSPNSGTPSSPGVQPGGTGTPGQGYPGGSHTTPRQASIGAGGGGAGSAGGNAPAGSYQASPGPWPTAGSGGIGRNIPWVPPAYGTAGPTPGRWFAGGGAGGATSRVPTRTEVFSPAVGGAGGGGRGRWARHPVAIGGSNPINNAVGEAGNVNTGGGAGGSGEYLQDGSNSVTVPGGTGGSGIVIIRYPYV